MREQSCAVRDFAITGCLCHATGTRLHWKSQSSPVWCIIAAHRGLSWKLNGMKIMGIRVERKTTRDREGFFPLPSLPLSLSLSLSLSLPLSLSLSLSLSLWVVLPSRRTGPRHSPWGSGPLNSRVARPTQWGGVGGPGGSPGARLRNCPEEEKEGKEEGKEDKEGKKQRGRRERVEGRREDRRTNKLRKQSKNKKS